MFHSYPINSAEVFIHTSLFLFFSFFLSYNDDLEQCFTGSMGDNCERTRQLYLSLLAGMRFPYCDLNELEQHVKLHEALALPEYSQRDAGSGAGGSPGMTIEDNGSGVNSVFMSGGVWARVGLLWLLWLKGV